MLIPHCYFLFLNLIELLHKVRLRILKANYISIPRVYEPIGRFACFRRHSLHPVLLWIRPIMPERFPQAYVCIVVLIFRLILHRFFGVLGVPWSLPFFLRHIFWNIHFCVLRICWYLSFLEARQRLSFCRYLSFLRRLKLRFFVLLETWMGQCILCDNLHLGQFMILHLIFQVLLMYLLLELLMQRLFIVWTHKLPVVLIGCWIMIKSTILAHRIWRTVEGSSCSALADCVCHVSV